MSSLFEDIESPKDKSPIEPVGNQPTQPAALVFSVDERKEWRDLLKKAMKEEFGEAAKDMNYSDFYLFILKKYYGEDASN